MFCWIYIFNVSISASVSDLAWVEKNYFENFHSYDTATNIVLVIIFFSLDTDTMHAFKVPYQFAEATVISFDYNDIYANNL